MHFHQPCTLLIPTRFYYSFSNVKDSLHLSYQKQRNSNLFYANALARINKVVFNVIPLNKLISGNTKFIRNSPDRIARYYGIVARTCRLIRSRCRTADPYALTRIDVIILILFQLRNWSIVIPNLLAIDQTESPEATVYF